jgi:hypothetical protein
MDQLLAQIAVPSLADAKHLGLAACGMLARGQTEPCRQVSTFGMYRPQFLRHL